MLVIGSWPDGEADFLCHFGDTKVAATLIQTGVLRCIAPGKRKRKFHSTINKEIFFLFSPRIRYRPSASFLWKFRLFGIRFHVQRMRESAAHLHHPVESSGNRFLVAIAAAAAVFFVSHLASRFAVARSAAVDAIRSSPIVERRHGVLVARHFADVELFASIDSRRSGR